MQNGHKSIRLEGGFTISEPVEEAFPLFSPIGEKAWAEGWDPEMIYPAGVEWEEGVVFRTPGRVAEAVWVVMRLDREAHRVRYHRVEAPHLAVQIEVRCDAAAAGGTDVRVAYTFIGLSDEGDRAIEGMSQASYDAEMLEWKSEIERRVR